MTDWSVARLVIFLIVTGGLVYFSRRSLLRPRTHGFVRFFVFEVILLLVLLNAPVWFADLFSWHQLISWVLLVGCLIPLFMGVRDLRMRGRPDAARRPEPNLFAFERTSQLVSSGIYGYIRHPLYASLMMLAWGVFFKVPSMVGAAMAALATAGAVMMARMDEEECLRVFGREYSEYMQRTKRFFPGLV